MKRLRVAVLMGGPSSEHSVSLASGHAVLSALDRERYDIVPVVIGKDGSWQVHKEAKAAFVEGRELPPLQREDSNVSWPGTYEPLPVEHLSFAPLGSDIDVAFIAMHGRYGEDGVLQGLLEAARIPFTGAGVLASALAMDKHRTLLLARALGVPIPDSVWVQRDAQSTPALAAMGEDIGYPLVVKPNRSGSSVGVSIVHKPSELSAALDIAFVEDEEILLQQYVKGRELHCGVLGSKKAARALPLDEVTTKHAFYDYKAKYQAGLAEHRIPAEVSHEVQEQLSGFALLLYEAVGCTGMARIDFFLGTEGPCSGRVLFNEINTIPGLTSTSIFPKEAAAAGMPFPELLNVLIADAYARAHPSEG